MIRRIEKVHEEKMIHRDIKPDNFLIGNSESTRDNIHIIDFGLAKLYKNSEDPLIQSLEELPESQVEKLIDILFTVEGKLFKKVNP